MWRKHTYKYTCHLHPDRKSVFPVPQQCPLGASQALLLFPGRNTTLVGHRTKVTRLWTSHKWNHPERTPLCGLLSLNSLWASSTIYLAAVDLSFSFLWNVLLYGYATVYTFHYWSRFFHSYKSCSYQHSFIYVLVHMSTQCVFVSNICQIRPVSSEVEIHTALRVRPKLPLIPCF